MPTIRAEIIGTICTALGITAHGSAPVLALCRKLVEAGHDPATPLEAWRGVAQPRPFAEPAEGLPSYTLH
jgi:hypothetical protein